MYNASYHIDLSANISKQHKSANLFFTFESFPPLIKNFSHFLLIKLFPHTFLSISNEHFFITFVHKS